MTESSDHPQRTRITSPHTGATSRARRTTAAEIDASTGVGEVFLNSLVRTQLRIALVITTVLVVTVGALPFAFAHLDVLTSARVGPVPLPWIVLGAGVYPGLLLLGWLYVRLASNAERDFRRLVEPRR